MTLAERLVEARTEKNWNKAELRRRAKITSPSTITEIEQGKRTESPQLGKIANALGVEIMWLQYGRGPKYIDRQMEHYTDEDIRIAALINKLDPEIRMSIERLLQAIVR